MRCNLDNRYPDHTPKHKIVIAGRHLLLGLKFDSRLAGDFEVAAVVADYNNNCSNKGLDLVADYYSNNCNNKKSDLVVELEQEPAQELALESVADIDMNNMDIDKTFD